jgi:heme exporter protein CcmD
MGGYGLYVWGSYAVVVAAIVIELAILLARTKAARKLAGAPRPGSED